MSELLVFISSIMDRAKEDLYAERDAAKAAVESLGLSRAWRFEDSPASSLRVDYSYLNRVADCDVFLLLLGREITKPIRMEYDAALEAGRPVLAFLKNVPRTPDANEFAGRLTVKWKAFDTADALQGEVRAALAQELIEAHRQKRLELPEGDVAALRAAVPAVAVTADAGVAVGTQSGGANLGAGARVSGPVAGGDQRITEIRKAGRDYYEARDRSTINVTQGAQAQELLALLDGLKGALGELNLPPHDQRRVQHELDGAALEAEAPRPDRQKVAASLQRAAEIVKSASSVALEATKFGALLKQGLTWAGAAVSALI